jgi:hypothetical protein
MKIAEMTGPGLDAIAIAERPLLPVPAGHVRIKVGAVSLNYRDVLIDKGFLPLDYPRIPLSDSAGEVVEVGAASPGSDSATGSARFIIRTGSTGSSHRKNSARTGWQHRWRGGRVSGAAPAGTGEGPSAFERRRGCRPALRRSDRLVGGDAQPFPAPR